jgi:hypothetical protein
MINEPRGRIPIFEHTDAKENRFSWNAVSPGPWRILAEIARRLDCCSASEAVSERTNNKIKRMLGSYRRQTGKELVLRRVHIMQVNDVFNLPEFINREAVVEAADRHLDLVADVQA